MFTVCKQGQVPVNNCAVCDVNKYTVGQVYSSIREPSQNSAFTSFMKILISNSAQSAKHTSIHHLPICISERFSIEDHCLLQQCAVTVLKQISATIDAHHNDKKAVIPIMKFSTQDHIQLIYNFDKQPLACNIFLVSITLTTNSHWQQNKLGYTQV